MDDPWAAFPIADQGSVKPSDDPWAAFPEATSESQNSGPLSNSTNDNFLTGTAKNIGTGIVKGLSNSVGVVGNLHNFADYLVARGENAITGKPVEDIQKEMKSQRAQQQTQGVPQDLTRMLPTGEDVSKPILSKTGEYQPETYLGKLGQAGVATAAGMVGPGGGLPAKGVSAGKALIETPIKMAPANFTAGVAGQGVTDLTGDPLAGMAAGTAAGSVASGAESAVRQARKPLDVRAGEKLQSFATDPNAVDRALNPGPMQPGVEPNYQLLEGHNPTLGQITNDQGILQAERAARTADNSDFNLREGEQNDAQITALANQSPRDADVMKPSEVFQKHLANIDDATNQALDHVTRRAQDLASDLGSGNEPEVNGEKIRNAIESVKEGQRQARNALYDAANPDGKLNVVTSGVADAAENISNKIGKYAGRPDGKEAEVFNQARLMPDVLPLRDLMDFDAQITDAMKADAAKNGFGETQTKARLTQLKGAVKEAINNAIENQSAWERQRAQRGTLAPENTIENRLNQFDAGQATGTGGAQRTAQQNTPAARPQSALSFMREGLGGVRDDGGNLVSAGIHTKYPGLVNNKSGLSPNDMRIALAQERYFGPDIDRAIRETTDTDLHDLISDAHNRYSSHDIDNLLDYKNTEAVKEQNRKIADAEGQIQQAYDDHNAQNGLKPEKIDPELLTEAAKSYIDDSNLSWDDALDRSAAQLEGNRGNYEAQSNAPRESERVSQGSVSGNGERKQTGAPNASSKKAGNAGQDRKNEGNSGLAPNLTDETAAAYRKAQAAHADYAKTYRTNPVAPVLKKSNGFDYNVQNSSVPSRVVVKGNSGYETLKSFLKASKNSPDVVAAAQDHVLNPLRKLNNDGTVNPKILASWKKDYAGALRALDEISPGFSKKFDTAASATDEMTRVGLARKQALDDFQKSEAAKFMGKTNQVEVENQIGSLITAKNGPTRMRELVKSAGSNQAALDGLRKAGIDWLLRTKSNIAQAAGTGKNLLSGAAFQKLIRDNHAALAELYPKETMNTFYAVADAMAQADRSVSATRIKGSPGSAKDMAAFFKEHHALADPHITGPLAMVEGVSHIFEGHSIIHSMGAVLAPILGMKAVGYLKTLHGAKIGKVQDMVRDALLNPDRARYYLSKVKRDEDASVPWYALTRSVRRELATMPMTAQSNQ